MTGKSVYSHILLIVFFGLFNMPGQGQPAEKLVWHDVPSGITVIKNTPGILQLQIHFSGIRVIEVPGQGGKYIRILHPDLTPSYHTGSPDLPVLRKLIEIPGGGKAVVEKLTYHTYHLSLEKKFPGTSICPSQPSVRKGEKTIPPPFALNKMMYAKDTYICDSLVELRKAGILRGRELMYLTLSPFHYNPVKNSLEIIDDINLTIRFTCPDQAENTYKSKSLASPVFHETFNKILNATPEETKEVVSGPVKYVILTDSMFRYAIRDFVRWKTQKGYRVIVVYKGAPGVGTTAESMKAYLRSLYDAATPDDPAFTFLLIIGDTDQIPPSAVTNQVTDLYYATYDGDTDYIPDVYYGRFSARDSVELMPQLNKTIEYEKYRFPDPSFLDDAVMVAGVDGTYASVQGNGQINYATEQYVNAGHGYNAHVYLYPASGSSDAQVIQDISHGASLVNYTGHGRSDRWEDPTFTISDIANLENDHKYPLIITNGCSSAAFGNPECFGEALLRAPHKGALGYIGCTNDSYWDEDYFWAVGVGPIVAHPSYKETSLAMYDRLFHDHGEPGEDWYVAQDQMIYAGNLAVMAGSPAKAKDYWEIYNLLGDPSLMIYLSQPDTLILNVPETIPLGLDNLSVVTEPGTYIGLTRHDSLLDASLADQNGIAMLHFPALQDTGYLYITGTKQNRRPFMDSVRIVSNQGPYVQLEKTILNDSLSNANGLAENGEDMFLDVRLKNIGKSDALNTSGILSTFTPWVKVTDSLLEPVTIIAGTDTLISHAFRIRIRDSIPDQFLATFRIRLSDNQGQQWDAYFTIILNAPVLKIGKLTIDDKKKGNGNLRLEPGEPVNFSLEMINEGHAPAVNSYALFKLTDSLVSEYQNSVYAGKIEALNTIPVSIPAVIDSTAPYGAVLTIYTEIHAGLYVDRDTFTLPVGLSYEDFETGNFSGFPWNNDTIHPWQVSNTSTWHGYFSAVSGEISDDQSSSLSINVDAFQDDSVSFYSMVSSEEDWDFLHFYIDGEEIGKWSGELPWAYHSFPVDSGGHTFVWKYTKDSNTSMGQDCAWVDYIVFPRHSFTKFNTGVAAIISPKSGTNLGDAELLTIAVKNFGTADIFRIPVFYQIDNQPVIRDTILRNLNPGDTLHFTFNKPLNLSVVKTYTLFVSTNLREDNVPVNDGLVFTVTHEGTIDLVLDSLVSPMADSVFAFNEKIGVRMINGSSGGIESMPLHYKINDSPVVSEIFDTIMEAGDTAIYYFKTRANLADTGDYIITVYSTVSGDAVTSNDTLVISLYNKILHVGSFRYFSHVLIYPNPAGDYLYIRFTGKNVLSFDVAVTDMTGRILFKRKECREPGENTLSISIGEFSPGTYLLILSNQKEKLGIPFIKK